MLFQPIDQSLSHVAVLGNALPRQCGLATYTSHSVEALRTAFPRLRIDHYAMDDGHGATYGPDIAMAIPERDVSAYVRAAAVIRRSGAQLLWIHHEFGIFGGSAGDHLLALLRHLEIPLVVTLHTVLARPDADQRRVMQAILAKADRLIVMAQAAARMLSEVHGVHPSRIAVVPHGAPDRPLVDTAAMKARLGLGAGPLVLTFGLLSPGKGIETAIRALPAVVAQQPDLLYLVLGATHPALVRDQGEAYRERLKGLAAELGVRSHVRFVDRFVADDELLDHLQAADIYLTPYLSPEQVTSGTLAYALAMGRPVVSTPYVHAGEALAGGIGTLVPFGDADAISAALCDLLGDPARLARQSRKVWRQARSTIWDHNARTVMDIFSGVKAGNPVTLKSGQPNAEERLVRLDGIAAMTDDVGIIQHGIHGIPERRHGYCIDDNARALMLLCQTRAGDPAERSRLTRIYAAFVEHGWNGQAGRFRNFMGYDRRWLDETGSEDSNGRTLWALGHVLRAAPEPACRRWAGELFDKALPLVEAMAAPRAIAFAMLGMAAVLDAEPGHARCRVLLRDAAGQFSRLLADARRPDWSWFEIMLSYDNARLPQAMIEAGRVLDDGAAIGVGLETLRWLLGMQTSPEGCFRPVGTESFGKPFASPAPFDQQPLEATATIDACLSAYRVDPGPVWRGAAHKAFAWFAGENDLATPLVGEDGTLCHDGLTPHGLNLNIGAESILALQMARHAMAAFDVGADDVPMLSAVR